MMTKFHDLNEATEDAYKAAERIYFDGIKIIIRK